VKKPKHTFHCSISVHNIPDPITSFTQFAIGWELKQAEEEESGGLPLALHFTHSLQLQLIQYYKAVVF
jgi:hypothetical protein